MSDHRHPLAIPNFGSSYFRRVSDHHHPQDLGARAPIFWWRPVFTHFPSTFFTSYDVFFSFSKMVLRHDTSARQVLSASTNDAPAQGRNDAEPLLREDSRDR